MPDVLLPVPHFEQSDYGYCLPACARMVLAHQNRQMSERELAEILGTQSFGTPISHINRLATLSCQITYRSFSEAELRSYLRQGIPVITRVWTGMLTYWTEASFHVLVVVGFDDEKVYLNDPAFADAPQVALWDSFLAAWAEYDEAAVVIQTL